VGDSRRLLKARNRSRFMVLATLAAGAGVLEYRKSWRSPKSYVQILLGGGHGKKAEEVWSDDTRSKELAVVVIAVKLSISESR